MTEPLVSILVPAHNAAPWIAQALESALAQTWERKEIIVVDDGSSDATLAIAEGFRERGVTVLAQAHSGASAARNRALAAARGDFLQYLDADDLLSPEKIAQQVRLLSGADRSADLAACWWRVFSEEIETARVVPQFDREAIDPIEYLVPYIAGEFMYPLHAWLIPRSLAEEAGPWDERAIFMDDTQYMCRILARCRRIHIARDSIAYYRRIDAHGSVSKRRDRRAAECGLDVVDGCVGLLLGMEDSSRTRRSAAAAYQHLFNHFHPRQLRMLRKFELRAAEHGGFRVELTGGPRAARIARIAGIRALYLVKGVQMYLRYLLTGRYMAPPRNG